MKRNLVRILSVTLLLALTLSISAFAVPAYTQQEREALWARFENEGIEAVLDDFCRVNSMDSNKFSVCYKNTVTGEEICLNENVWFTSGGIYVIPLNMAYTDKLAAGEVSGKLLGYAEYEQVRDDSIILFADHSNDVLREALGGYDKSRRIVLQYTDAVKEDELDAAFFSKNLYTGAMLLDIMDKLYADSEKYAGIIDAMKRTEEGKYLASYDAGVEIAHKPGEYDDCTNDVAIVYTEQPFLLVECSRYVGAPREVQGAVTRLFVEYNLYSADKAAKEAEKAAAEKAEQEAKAEQERLAAEQAEAERKAQEEAEKAAAEAEQARLAAEEEAARQAEEAAQAAQAAEEAEKAAAEEAAKKAQEQAEREAVLRNLSLRREVLEWLCIFEFALLVIALIAVFVRSRRRHDKDDDFEDEDEDDDEDDSDVSFQL